MINRDQYIQAYKDHYDKNGLSGSGVGLGDKPDILKRGGYNDTYSLLDYGCGWGAILQGINPVDYIGVDIVPKAIEYAKNKFSNKRFEVLKIGQLKTEPMDFAIALSVFTHALYSDVKDCLKDIHSNLKPNGKAIVDILEGKRNEDVHFRYWPKEEFVKELTKAGFSVTGEYLYKAKNGFIHTYFFICKT